MYLSRIYIENYRSIKKLDLRFISGKNIIIGRNNAGKSNIIKAIDLALGENSPDYNKSENITDSDFFTVNGNKSSEIIIWCELTRLPHEDLDYEELYKCFGYYIWKENGAIKRIKTCDVPARLSELFTYALQDNKEKTYINPKQKNNMVLENELGTMFSFAYGFRAIRNEDGKVDKEIRLFYRENDSSDWIMSFKAPFRNELLQSAIIPSFRDPQIQLRISQWGWYGKLMKHLTQGYEANDELKGALSTVNRVAGEIFSGISEKIEQSSVAVAFPGTKLHFQFNTENRTDLYKSCVLYVDDGYKSQLTEKGSGIQSAVIIGLFNYYTQFVSIKSSALLCIEEPELYLHPHARRVINNKLSDFLNGNRNQVILSTHSSEFINAPDSMQIILVRKVENETLANRIEIRKIQNLLIDNNQNEIFFADKVILCEGFDQYIVRMIADGLFPGKMDELNVSVLSVKGKDQIKQMSKHLTDLQIECYVLADFDFLLRDKSDDRKQYGEVPAHESIRELGNGYFCQSYLFGANGNSILGRIDKLRNSMKAKFPESFYTAKRLSEIPDCTEKSQIVELLTELRSHGICILSGQIEDLFINQDDFQGNKLGLTDVYTTKQKLTDGTGISDLFYTDEIMEFLSHVFDEPLKDGDSTEEEIPF
jgi:predicted ATP-dependent endonuclease of OLD family